METTNRAAPRFWLALLALIPLVEMAGCWSDKPSPEPKPPPPKGAFQQNASAGMT